MPTYVTEIMSRVETYLCDLRAMVVSHPTARMVQLADGRDEIAADNAEAHTLDVICRRGERPGHDVALFYGYEVVGSSRVYDFTSATTPVRCDVAPKEFQRQHPEAYNALLGVVKKLAE